MLWGCLGNGRLGPLQFIERTVDSAEYQKILEVALPAAQRDVFGGQRFVFQQDNAPAHTSKSTARWMKQNHVQLLDWPPQSPDFNPIENLWAIAKGELDKLRPIRDLRGLKDAVEKTLQAIKPETFTHLIESMPRRCRAVINNHGGPIGY